MIYKFGCPECGAEEEVSIPLSFHSHAVANAICTECEVKAKQLLTPTRQVWAREAFPKGMHEHIAPDPVYIRDRKEAMDVAAENGLTSVYCENRV
jgi:hypothetical protein